jgi:pyrroline-5-carboxylate reductase
MPTQCLTGKRITVVGAGNMGRALVRGLMASGGVKPTDLTVAGPRLQTLLPLQQAYGVCIEVDNQAACQGAQVVVLAVKPQRLQAVLQGLEAGAAGSALFISIAAGLSLAAVESYLPEGAHVCRAMPNTPVVVGAGATALSAGAHATAADVALATAIFASVGTVTPVDDSLMDAVTGLSGCGPAYMFTVVEALCDAGVRVGLPRPIALALAAQTVLGSGELLLRSGTHPMVLKDQVTSPGGATIAGLHRLEEGGLRAALINAVVAATERARQLGETLGQTSVQKNS